jgi:hypothetical protein
MGSVFANGGGQGDHREGAAPSEVGVGLGLTLTQHLLLLLRLPLAWCGPWLGPEPACLTLTHLSVCLICQSASSRGPHFSLRLNRSPSAR